MADDPVEEDEAMRWIPRLLRDDGGAIEMEYGLFAALFAVGAVAVLQLAGVLQRF